MNRAKFCVKFCILTHSKVDPYTGSLIHGESVYTFSQTFTSLSINNYGLLFTNVNVNFKTNKVEQLIHWMVIEMFQNQNLDLTCPESVLEFYQYITIYKL
jgi:hypothetical protein